MAGVVKTYQVSIGNSGQVIRCAANETILHAAIMAGIDYPYACASGNCGTCISRLDEGKVTMLPRGDAAISAAQVKAGQTLACRAQPKGDVAITWLGRGRR
jgi:ferredoxin-NAD(P)+ reductase (naphthalene dioxygenase ferredoxin-specific)